MSALLCCTKVSAVASTAADLIKLDFEDLVTLDVIVQTAGKSDTRAMDLAYAAHVITASEILQSGVQTIPDALRLAPGVKVRQISANEWAVGIRGAEARYSRFMLVSVDGRIANNTLFSGVNWDELNIPVDNIARIEVIRGPNAASWGANAVNGIVNIITRRYNDPAPGSLNALVGSNDALGASLSQSIVISPRAGLQVAGQYRRGGGGTKQSIDEEREANLENWAFSTALAYMNAADSGGGQGHLTFGAFESRKAASWGWPNSNTLARDMAVNHDKKRGYVIQGDYRYLFSPDYQWKIRASAEKTDRAASLYDWHSENYQFDAEMMLEKGQHRLSSGVNTRRNYSEVSYSSLIDITFDPSERYTNSWGVYFSDAISLSPVFEMTMALRVDDSDLSHKNIQPSLRGLWKPSPQQRFWAAYSEASTTPSRAFLDLSNRSYAIIPATLDRPLPVLLSLDGYQSMQADTRLTSIELGYRKTRDNLSMDLSLFHFDYDNDIGVELLGEPTLELDEFSRPSLLVQRLAMANNRSYTREGGELVLSGNINDWWSTQVKYSRLRDPESHVPWSAEAVISHHFDFYSDMAFTVVVRHSHGTTNLEFINELTVASSRKLDNYLVFDASLSWRINNHWTLSVMARDLGDDHVEALRELFTSPIQVVETSYLAKIALAL